MTADAINFKRLMIETLLDRSLPLWLDAIEQGDYSEAKLILNTRRSLRAELTKLLRQEQEHGEVSD